MDADLRALLEKLMVTSRYRPARLWKGKDWIISYSAWHQGRGRLVRKRELINHIRDRAERLRYAKQRITEINLALSLGWTPWDKGSNDHGAQHIKGACEEFLVAKQTGGLRPDSMRSYRSLIRILSEWLHTCGAATLGVSEFSVRHALRFMQESVVTRKLSARTFNNYHTFFTTLWNWFKENGYAHENVFSRVKKLRTDPEGSTRRPPTRAERAAIRDYLERNHPRFFAFCLLCFHCGIRPKEAFMLRPEHFNIAGRFIVVPGSVAKNHRTQGVAIPDVMAPELERLGIEGMSAEDYVFSTGFEPGKKLCNSRDSGRAWTNMREAIGLPQEVTMYQLKHAGGEQLSRDGVSEVDLMNHLRHHDLSETSTYTRRTYKMGVRDVLKKASKF